MPSLGDYGIVAGVAALVTFLISFPVRKIALRLKFVAIPDGRSIHEKLTPYGGGVSMTVAVLVAIGVASLLSGIHTVFSGSSESYGVIIGVLVIFAVGFVDDIREVSAPAKVAGEVLAATALYFLGVTMYQFKIPFAGFVVLSPAMIPLLVSLWVVGMTNAINLVDGLDGLAAGIVAIASGALAIYGLRLESLGILPSSNIGPLIAVVTFGACIGFLPHNFNPARMFMGDSGSLLLGLLMAASTIVIGGRAPEVSGTTYFFFAPLFLPLFILGVPIADMAFAFIRRTARGQSFHTPDKDHLHHRLLRLGHGHRRSVIILWLWTALLSAVVLFPLFTKSGSSFIPLVAAGFGLLLYTLFRPGLKYTGGDQDSQSASDAPVSGTSSPPPPATPAHPIADTYAPASAPGNSTPDDPASASSILAPGDPPSTSDTPASISGIPTPTTSVPAPGNSTPTTSVPVLDTSASTPAPGISAPDTLVNREASSFGERRMSWMPGK